MVLFFPLSPLLLLLPLFLPFLEMAFASYDTNAYDMLCRVFFSVFLGPSLKGCRVGPVLRKLQYCIRRELETLARQVQSLARTVWEQSELASERAS